MELKLSIDGAQQGQKLKQNLGKAGQSVRDAMRGAARTAADEILFRGAEDIGSAGKFGERWQEALNVNQRESQRTLYLDVVMRGGPPVSYWHVFEYGATITAHNPSGLLWLPFSGSEGTDVWPSAYAGNLFRTTSKGGVPLLGDADEAKGGGDPQSIFKYHGHASVTIPQKFHLRDIITQVAKELRGYYAEHMK